MKVQENEKLKEDYRPKISLGIDMVSDVIRLEHQERRKESTFVGCLEAIVFNQWEEWREIGRNCDLCV